MVFVIGVELEMIYNIIDPKSYLRSSLMFCVRPPAVTPPFIPTVMSNDDTSNFEEFDKARPKPFVDEFKGKAEFSGKDLPFIGFTYTKQISMERYGNAVYYHLVIFVASLVYLLQRCFLCVRSISIIFLYSIFSVFLVLVKLFVTRSIKKVAYFC